MIRAENPLPYFGSSESQESNEDHENSNNFFPYHAVLFNSTPGDGHQKYSENKVFVIEDAVFAE